MREHIILNDRSVLKGKVIPYPSGESGPQLDLNFATMSVLDSQVTYSGASTRLQRNASGDWEYAPHNLFAGYSEDFTTGWTNGGGTITMTSSYGSKDGVATTLLQNTTTGLHTLFDAITVSPGFVYEASVIAKDQGGGWMLFGASGFDDEDRHYFDLANGAVGSPLGVPSGSASIEDLGDGYYRCKVTFSTTTDTAGSIYIYLAEGDADISLSSSSGFDIEVGGIWFRRTPAEDTYIKTEGSAVYQARLNHYDSAGAVKGLLLEAEATNSLLQNRDLTTTWATVGTSVVSQNETGITGEANTAHTLTDDNGSGSEYIYQNVTIPNDSNVHVARVWIKQDSDETRFPSVALNLTGGTLQRLGIHINTSSGATSVIDTAGTVAHEVNDRGAWWEVLIEVANNSTGNTTAQLLIEPADGTVFGTKNDLSATGSIIVDAPELHLNALGLDRIRGTSPIFTTTGTVTKSKDLTKVSGADFTNFYTDGPGTVVAEGWIEAPDLGNQYFWSINDDSASNHQSVEMDTANTLLKLVMGFEVDNVPLGYPTTGNSVTAATLFKVACGWAADDLGICLDGGTVVTDSDTSGEDAPNNVDQLNIGHKDGSFVPFAFTCTRIRYYAERKTNAELQELTT